MTMHPTYAEQFINKLKAENAELRAKLYKAVELPRAECIMTREWLNREIIGDIMFEWCVLYKKDGYIMAEPCLSKEAAEARLKEINEGDVKYTEILKLKKMLEEANIPFTFTDDFWGVKKWVKSDEDIVQIYREQYPAYQIRLGALADVVEHYGSYGEEKDLLEIMGGLTEEEMKYDSVLGYLTAEEVFKRVKYCWEHQTSVYKEEEE